MKYDHTELFGIVRDAMIGHGVQDVACAIDDANRGRPDGMIVTRDNQHLFRRYRNEVSGDAAQLMRDAKAAGKRPQFAPDSKDWSGPPSAPYARK
jgi:hypothetical protein